MELTSEEIEALKNGAFGITRGGSKVKYVGEDADSNHCWASYLNDGTLFSVNNVYDTFNTFNLSYEDPRDIVGLWQDKPEPFNLERALQGEPVQLRNGTKAFVLAQANQPKELLAYALIGYIIEDDFTKRLGLWGINGRVSEDYESNKDIIGMWKEPVPLYPHTLPKPIREFGTLEKVWFIRIEEGDNIYIPAFSYKGSDWTERQHKRLENGFYYATKEACQKVCDWLMNRSKHGT